MQHAEIPRFSNQLASVDIDVTTAAGEQFTQLLSQGEDEFKGIRIFVTGGGCSGMTYGMTYADAIHENDCLLQGEGYSVVVDAVALNYLRGCQIDFTTHGLNSSFVFNNVFRAVGGSGACGGCGGGAGGGCGM